MNKYSIRFNKSRGQAGCGTRDHVWRVFENDNEVLARHVRIECRSWTELDKNGVDFNVACYGQRMLFYSDTDTVVILEE